MCEPGRFLLFFLQISNLLRIRLTTHVPQNTKLLFHSFYTIGNKNVLPIHCILFQQEFTGEPPSSAVAFVPVSFHSQDDGPGDGPFKALMIASDSGPPKCIASERNGTLSVKTFNPVYPHPGTIFVITEA